MRAIVGCGLPARQKYSKVNATRSQEAVSSEFGVRVERRVGLHWRQRVPTETEKMQVIGRMTQLDGSSLTKDVFSRRTSRVRTELRLRG